MGTPLQSASIRPNNVPNLEIVGAPYIPLLGQGFYKDAIPVRLTNNTNTIQIGSKGLGAMAPVSITFGGHTENNLKYAQTKSSLRIGQPGSWTTLNTPRNALRIGTRNFSLNKIFSFWILFCFIDSSLRGLHSSAQPGKT